MDGHANYPYFPEGWVDSGKQNCNACGKEFPREELSCVKGSYLQCEGCHIEDNIAGKHEEGYVREYPDRAMSLVEFCETMSSCADKTLNEGFAEWQKELLDGVERSLGVKACSRPRSTVGFIEDPVSHSLFMYNHADLIANGPVNLEADYWTRRGQESFERAVQGIPELAGNDIASPLTVDDLEAGHEALLNPPPRPPTICGRTEVKLALLGADKNDKFYNELTELLEKGETVILGQNHVIVDDKPMPVENVMTLKLHNSVEPHTFYEEKRDNSITKLNNCNRKRRR